MGNPGGSCPGQEPEPRYGWFLDRIVIVSPVLQVVRGWDGLTRVGDVPVQTPPFPTASWGRRILALLVDWLACTLVVIGVVGLDAYTEPGSTASFAVLGLYVAETTLLTWLAGGSFGKLATRLRVVWAGGGTRPMNPLRLLARQVLVVLVVPPLVWRPDGRGLHDLAAGTCTITLDTYRSLGVGRA